MSLARAALRELDALAALLARRTDLPETSRCRQQADARPPVESATALPPPEIIEATRLELQAICAVPGGAASLSPRSLRMAPLVLWNGKPQAASFPGLLEVVVRTAQARPRVLRDLIEAWLRDFGPDRILLREGGLAISRLLAGTRHPRLTAWRDADQRFRLFDATDGPSRLGQALLTGDDDVADILARAGMNDPLRANGGFFRAAVAEAVKALPAALRGLSAQPAWARAAGLLEVAQTRTDRFGRAVSTTSLRFAELTGRTGRACLEPWLRGSAAAYAPQEEIKAFLLRVIGDPRVQPGRWAEVGEEATGLMRSWLAKASLEAFLSLIAQNSSAQWRYRQKFWRACLDRMPSAEVWVVLGPGMATRAKTIRDLAGSYGQMDGSGTNEQAVLLMRLGNLVLSEWSNVGPVRAWEVGGPSCPQLYQSRYTSTQLRSPSLLFPDHPVRQRGGSSDGGGLIHNSGDSGLWQGCAAALLFDRLQLRLTPKDYMP